MNQLDFEGRHAVVTGGATGLGCAIAQRMIASGGSVSLWDRDGPGALEAAGRLGPRALAVAVDVVDHSSVAAAVEATLGNSGRIDALVNSAGITGPNVKVWDYPLDAWRQVLEDNLTDLIICCREVVPHMRQRNYGRIVNNASVAGNDGNPNANAYFVNAKTSIGSVTFLNSKLPSEEVENSDLFLSSSAIFLEMRIEPEIPTDWIREATFTASPKISPFSKTTSP